MSWKKCGRIFNPEEHDMMYAKSPQAVEFEDFVRIYFSDCKNDNDKLISYVCFADFTKDFKQIIKVKRQIIEDGGLGCFDEHGIFPFSPYRDSEKFIAYTTGWTRRVSVSTDTGIGIVQSLDNGETFTRIGTGPILTSCINEPMLVCDGFVRKFNGQYHMWYISGTEWKIFKTGLEPDRIYKIRHAVSSDGISWLRESKQIIADSIDDESQALPSVVEYKGLFHMFFCFRDSFDFRCNANRGYRIGHAISKNLINWQRCDEHFHLSKSESGWDSEMICYPNIFVINNRLYILYNGNQFGRIGFGIAVWEDDNERL